MYVWTWTLVWTVYDVLELHNQFVRIFVMIFKSN